jgi:hypothetical protein
MQQRFNIEEDSIRRRSRSATCGWVRASGNKQLWFPGYSSSGTPCSCREQFTPELVEIGERKHGVCAGQVLGQTAVSDLGKAPQLLDDPKRVFATRPGPRACPIDKPPAFAQRALRAPSIDTR